MRYKDIFEATDNRTPAYRFTYNPSNPADWLKLKQLKSEVRDHNKSVPQDKWGEKDESGRAMNRKRVSMRGRLGKDNPNSSKYDPKSPDRDKSRPSRRSYAGPQHIKKDDASRFDVYVHDVSKPFKFDREG